MTRETQGAGEILYALDIGTGSVTGLLARREGDRMRVLELVCGVPLHFIFLQRGL